MTDTIRSSHEPEQCAPAWALLATVTEIFSQDNVMGRGLDGPELTARLRGALSDVRREAARSLRAIGAPVPWDKTTVMRSIEEKT